MVMLSTMLIAFGGFTGLIFTIRFTGIAGITILSFMILTVMLTGTLRTDRIGVGDGDIAGMVLIMVWGGGLPTPIGTTLIPMDIMADIPIIRVITEGIPITVGMVAAIGMQIPETAIMVREGQTIPV